MVRSKAVMGWRTLAKTQSPVSRLQESGLGSGPNQDLQKVWDKLD